MMMFVEGAVMAELAEALLAVQDCGFKPMHVNKLANEFHCYTNYTTSVINASHNTADNTRRT